MKLRKNILKNTNKQKGITLIALVITIIVLLILAGVAVSSITGSDGVMDKAQNAKTATDNSNDEEMVKMAVVQAMADEKTLGMLTQKNLSDALEGKATVSEGEAPWTVTTPNAEYTVDENGGVNKTGGQGEPVASTYTITYNANGGSGTMQTTEGVSPVIASNRFTAPNGKGFYGWNTSSDGTGIYYMIGTTLHENTTLYAQWVIVQNISTAISTPSTQYGEYINLGTNILTDRADDEKTDWRIFYKDTSNSNNVYVILTDYLPNSTNIAATVGLVQKYEYSVGCDTTESDFRTKLGVNSTWKSKLLADSILEENSKFDSITARGAVTANIFLASYNAKYSSGSEYTLKYDTSQKFYINKNSSEGLDYLYVRRTKNNCDGCWFDTARQDLSSYTWGLDSSYILNDGNRGTGNTPWGIRPAIILPADLQVYKDSNGVWQIQ